MSNISELKSQLKTATMMHSSYESTAEVAGVMSDFPRKERYTNWAAEELEKINAIQKLLNPTKEEQPETEEKPFLTVHTRGFQMRFENGNRVSVVFGNGCYCEHKAGNKWDRLELEAFKSKGYWDSQNAEVAAWDSEDNRHNFVEGDTVKGYLTPDEVSNFIAWVSNPHCVLNTKTESE